MRLQTLFAVSLLVAGCGGGFVPLQATAQESRATPATDAAIVLPYTPQADDCRVEPRPVAFFTDAATAILATPVTTRPVPPASPTPDPALADPGVAADAETTAEVVAVVAEVEACANTGDILRLLSLLTDAGAEESFVRGFGPAIQNARWTGDRTFNSAEELLAWVFGTPQPAAPTTTLVAVDDVRVLPDGRITAVVTRLLPEVGDITSLVVLERDGGRLRFVIELNRRVSSASEAGTPVP